ncbi:hypothetical protein [Haloterrigena longa]|uniref:Uncharacterized protein n=1 Tax=Natrinema longum TaxID=370324 RepID=A0A8A2UE73_9EURY|nr:dienelactone hydrolase family protein [Natrinema longum]QSW87029.1 hypothetical protein J0X27_16170 [Natrinema longum]
MYDRRTGRARSSARTDDVNQSTGSDPAGYPLEAQFRAMLTETPGHHHVTGIVGDAQAAIDGSLEGTPVLVGYGDADPHVASEHVAETIRAFEESDAAVDERCSPETGHEATADECTAIGAMLERVLEG